MLREPVLGLDLEGGAEVVLKATPEPGQEVTPEILDQAVSILRERVDTLGVTEPEIRKESGNDISIAVAGESDPKRVSTSSARPASCTSSTRGGPHRGRLALGRRGRRHHAEELAVRAAEGRRAAWPSATATRSCSRSTRARPTSRSTVGRRRRGAAEAAAGGRGAPRGRRGARRPKGKVAVSCSSRSPAGCPPDIAPDTEHAQPEQTYWYMFDVPTEDRLLTGTDLDGTGRLRPADRRAHRHDGLRRARRQRLQGDHERPRRPRQEPVRPGGRQRRGAGGLAAGVPAALRGHPRQRARDLPDDRLPAHPGRHQGRQRPDHGPRRAQEAKDIALVLQSGSLPVEFKTLSQTQVSATLGKDSLARA